MSDTLDRDYESALITDQAFEDIGDHHATCPVCGASDGALRAAVSVYYDNVALWEDGYVPNDGHQIEDEITEIHCSECGAIIPVDYYFTGVYKEE